MHCGLVSYLLVATYVFFSLLSSVLMRHLPCCNNKLVLLLLLLLLLQAEQPDVWLQLTRLFEAKLQQSKRGSKKRGGAGGKKR